MVSIRLFDHICNFGSIKFIVTRSIEKKLQIEILWSEIRLYTFFSEIWTIFANLYLGQFGILGHILVF